MKKKVLLPIIAAVVLLAVLFVPIPRGTCEDGGTRDYTALTYRLVRWNRLTNNGTFKKTSLYFGDDRSRSLDELYSLEREKGKKTFLATVIEVNENSVVVKPLEDEEELKSSDKISFDTGKFTYTAFMVGSVMEITYSGEIMESYPAQIVADSCYTAKTFRKMNFSKEWLNDTAVKSEEDEQTADVYITEIFADCFFGRLINSAQYYEIKLNGKLSDEWCVNDAVSVTFSNIYYDNREYAQADFSSVKKSAITDKAYEAAKPVIYLYPENETNVSVELDFNGNLSCTYPEYRDGWNVTAAPDGTLTDESGKTYNYLYWEGESNTQYDFSKGFCVKGEDTAAFLEASLAKLGLTRREANEFIVYWLPVMQNNRYNIISFQKDSYTESAKLFIDPNPDTLIRVFMAWKPSDEYVSIEEQTLTQPERNGFTAVEWGGTQVK